jgi:hypothetical protein
MSHRGPFDYGRGGLSGLETLQDGHGIPAPPHPHACSPSMGGHRATRKPKTCPDSGRTSRAFSFEHKLGTVDERQLYGFTQGDNVALRKQQFDRPLPLRAVMSILR